MMNRKDFLLAAMIAAIWGLNFSLIKLGVAQLDPFLLAGCRFTLTAIPLVFFLPRPAVAWRWLVAYGLAFGVGTWGLVTLSLRAGLSPGLAAWLLQSSAFLTPLLGMLWLKEAMTKQQRWGGLLALLGFTIVLCATDGTTTLLGTGLVLLAAISLSVANLVVKRSGAKAMLAFLAWASLFAPIPLFVLAYLTSGAVAFTKLPVQMNGIAWASLAFQVYPTTLFGYWVWNTLIARNTVASVAPVALLVPIFALTFAFLIFGLLPTAGQTVGISLILVGLLVSVLGGHLRRGLERRQRVAT